MRLSGFPVFSQRNVRATIGNGISVARVRTRRSTSMSLCEARPSDGHLSMSLPQKALLYCAHLSPCSVALPHEYKTRTERGRPCGQPSSGTFETKMRGGSKAGSSWHDAKGHCVPDVLRFGQVGGGLWGQ